ncbi:hypothetical protein KSF_107720 [Reticulibacter mediterranei]|uniref:Uncharacterized protein n=1 Tax=Reticulibacter mediterranei TaxID=2778369 RepID=A0A8J3IRK2_9CHLR|nr:hypothetical protein [Reticulibacter mediterranei]GHP00725.1 hypothetical protein KSF_107720 [Reticulibacter mediterranei]
MSEDQGWFYTNTFAVTNNGAFRSFCKKHKLRIFREGNLVGCFHPWLGIPQIRVDTSDEQVFLRELGRYLQDEHVAIAVDVRVTEREHCSTSWQITYAINNKGEIKSINPVEIFSVARSLGTQIAPLQDMVPPQDVTGMLTEKSSGAADLARMLQKAVNTISYMLMNIADVDDHRNPESGMIFSDVVRGALFLEETIKIGFLPDNYAKDGVADLIEEVKTQEAQPEEEQSSTTL